MDGTTDKAASSGLPIFTIPSLDKTDAIDFIIEKLKDAEHQNICSTVQFDSTDGQFLNLCDLWDDFKERIILDDLWMNREPRLSFASPESLVVKFMGAARVSLTYQVDRIFSDALRKARRCGISPMHRCVIEREIEFSGDVARPRELYSADGGIVSIVGDVPFAWCEVADRETYKYSIDKIMRMSSLFPTIGKFYIVCFYSKQGTRPTSLGDNFVADFQSFDRLTDMSQLGDASMSTLGVRSSHRNFPFPDPESRRLDQNFDLVLTTRRAYEYTKPFEDPVFQLVGNDNIMRQRIVESIGPRGAVDVDLESDLSTAVRQVKMIIYSFENTDEQNSAQRCEKRRKIRQDDIIRDERGLTNCYDPVRETLVPKNLSV